MENNFSENESRGTSDGAIRINLYLDFDGVLHSTDSTLTERNACCCEIPEGAFANQQILVDAIEGLPVQVVVSSAWRNHDSVIIQAIRDKRLHQNILDRLHDDYKTPYSRVGDYRRQEIMGHDRDAIARGLFVVLDDQAHYFENEDLFKGNETSNQGDPWHGAVVICDGKKGLDKATGQVLRQLIKSRLATASGLKQAMAVSI